MNKGQSQKQYDLEERTFKFAKRVREFVKNLPKTLSNIQDIPQLIRASGSIGANYIEATESLSKKDFYHRLRISRKEAKETKYWLKIINVGIGREVQKEREFLVEEAYSFSKIFGSIISRYESEKV